MKYALIPLLFAAPAMAQDFAPRLSDTLPTADILASTILDHDLEYFDGGVSRYNTDGSYTWTYSAANGSGVWEGTHTMSDNVVCILFSTGQERCDMFVTSNDRLTVITEDGDRYPIRSIQ